MESLNLEFGARRLPLILQTESAECGLACLAMIACHHGFRTDLPTLRGRYGLSLRGANLERVCEIAESLKFGTRAARLELDEMTDLETPCILHWDLNHFVVLRKATRKGIVIHDPAVGVRHLNYAEASPHFSGVALELTPATDFVCAEEQRKVSLKKLIGSVSGWWGVLCTVLFMALTLECFAIVAPMFNQWVVDEALVSGDRGLLNVLAFGLLMLTLTQAALAQARGWTVMYMSTHLNLQWVGNVFGHLLHLPMSWFEKRSVGDVCSRFGSVGAIQRTLTTSFIGAVLDGLMAVVTLVMMLWYSATLSMVVLATVMLYALLRAVAYMPLREAAQEGLALGAKEQSVFLESIRAMQAIKLSGRELDRRGRWLSAMVDSVNRGVRTEKLNLLFGSAETLVAGVSSALMLWIGAGMVMNGTFTVGMMFAFSAYGAQFGGRMSSLIDKTIEFKMLSLHTERLADIVLEPVEPEAKQGRRIEKLEPRIELVNVSFRYSEGDPWVIKGVNLVIEPGESLAIVGPSGGGKTTLVKLILSVLPVTEGEIRYGGVPIQQLGTRDYRSALGVVMQDDQLLAGSLADNISFFDQRADLARVERCAAMAAIAQDIDAMPMGYDTLAGDMGTTLSGGQKQRILLARALYKEPQVLILDEATSHLDVSLEKSVNAAVAALKVTRIIVAHRPETIASARRVIALVGGVIALDKVQTAREA